MNLIDILLIVIIIIENGVEKIGRKCAKLKKIQFKGKKPLNY